MANLNLNKAIIAGRLTATPELRTTANGTSVVRFTVAVNRRYTKGEQQRTDFLNVTAWRQTAEFVSRYFAKGRSICICGSIQTRKYKDRDGNERVATEIVADEANFVDSRTDTPPAAQKPADEACNSPSGGESMVDIGEDDDLPF